MKESVKGNSNIVKRNKKKKKIIVAASAVPIAYSKTAMQLQ